jgi:antitoxin HigA-1
MTTTLAPVTPGELLLEEFLLPMGITKYRLAKEIGVPAQRIGEIVAGRRSVTADTDLRLCRFFGLSDGYWLRAQVALDSSSGRRERYPEASAWAAAHAQHVRCTLESPVTGLARTASACASESAPVSGLFKGSRCATTAASSSQVGRSS